MAIRERDDGDQVGDESDSLAHSHTPDTRGDALCSVCSTERNQKEERAQIEYK